MCLSTGEDESRFLLPVLNVGVMVGGGPMVRFNALFDTESCRSYLSNEVLQKLNIDSNNLK